MHVLFARFFPIATRRVVPDTPAPRNAHLTSDDVAAYVSARFNGAERHRMEAHLADCDVCRTEVLEVRSLLQSAPRTRWVVPRALPVAAAAAAILLIAIAPWRNLREKLGSADAGVGAERSALPDDARDSVAIVSPGLDDAIAPGGLQVVWRRGPVDAQFTVTVLSERGDIRWSTVTRDTAITVPDTVTLAPSGVYAVYVDALRADGTSARSPLRTFTVR